MSRLHGSEPTILKHLCSHMSSTRICRRTWNMLICLVKGEEVLQSFTCFQPKLLQDAVRDELTSLNYFQLLDVSLCYSLSVKHQLGIRTHADITDRETWLLFECIEQLQLGSSADLWGQQILRDAARLPLQICLCRCQVALRRSENHKTNLVVCCLCGPAGFGGSCWRSLGWQSHTQPLNHLLQTAFM